MKAIDDMQSVEQPVKGVEKAHIEAQSYRLMLDEAPSVILMALLTCFEDAGHTLQAILDDVMFTAQLAGLVIESQSTRRSLDL